MCLTGDLWFGTLFPDAVWTLSVTLLSDLSTFFFAVLSFPPRSVSYSSSFLKTITKYHFVGLHFFKPIYTLLRAPIRIASGKLKFT